MNHFVQKRVILVSLLTFSCWSPMAQAEMRMTIPQSHLAEPGKLLDQDSHIQSTHEWVVSSYSPESLRLFSRIQNASEFKRGIVPQLGFLMHMSPFYSHRSFSVGVSAGGWLMSLKREGFTQVMGVRQKTNQSLFLTSAQLSLEMASKLARSWSLFAEAGFNALGGISPRSRFDDGRNMAGVGLSFRGGLIWSPSMTGILEGMQSRISWQQWSGKMEEGNLTGGGFALSLSTAI